MAIANPPTPIKSTAIRMTPDKECKGSVRYAAADDKAPVQSVYLDRSFANPMPAAITVTVAAV